MEVILLKRVEKLGSLGDKVTVKPGYGRNHLIPTGRAIAATSANLKEFEERRAELEREAFSLLSEAEMRKASFTDLRLTIARRAGEEGRLYGSVGAADIAMALQTSGYAVEKQEIRLPKGPCRAVGEYDVVLHLHSSINVTIKVEIVAED